MPYVWNEAVSKDLSDAKLLGVVEHLVANEMAALGRRRGSTFGSDDHLPDGHATVHDIIGAIFGDSSPQASTHSPRLHSPTASDEPPPHGNGR